jgi:hypothetical protein
MKRNKMVTLSWFSPEEWLEICVILFKDDGVEKLMGYASCFMSLCSVIN